VLTEHGCKISPSTYYAHRSRPPSARAVRDITVLAEITRVHSSKTIGRGLYGARKVWHQLAREGLVVPRCQVERLMRAAGLRGIRRGRQFITTRPDPRAARLLDLVKRDFTAPAPNVLWVVDFTYVPTWSGMAFTAFVTDVFSRRIIGWRTAASMPTELPLDALEMALWTRGRAGQPTAQVVHHSDAGAQGGFNRSSQHLVIMEVFGGKTTRGDDRAQCGAKGATTAVGCGSGVAPADAITGPAGALACGAAGVLAADRFGCDDGRGRGGHRCVVAGRGAVVPARWRNAADQPGRARGPLLVVR
jgi:putative transposase